MTGPRCRGTAIRLFYLFWRCFMHKLLGIGWVCTGLVAFGIAGSAHAMRPASNADLRGCFGMETENNEKCVDGAMCSATPIGVSPCTLNDQGPENPNVHCYTNEQGPRFNSSCQGTYPGSNCSPPTSMPCITWDAGICGIQGDINHLTPYCDTSQYANDNPQSSPTNVQTCNGGT
jgi:hypothetical protein